MSDYEVHGNVAGIKASILEQISHIYDLEHARDCFFSTELIEQLSFFTGLINREILVYISRSGLILDVRIGDSRSVSMPEFRVSRNADGLCGVRCIHSHPDSSGILSDVDLGSLASIRLDASAAVGVSKEGKPLDLYVAFLNLSDNGEIVPEIIGPLNPYRIPNQILFEALIKSNSCFQTKVHDNEGQERQKAILCGIQNAQDYDSLSELALLAETAGIDVVGMETQNRELPDRSTYFGSGKLEDVALKCSALQADLLVFDDELNAVQMRNIEELTGAAVIDRIILILDIFANRATSKEGKLQVELAQLKYRLPRLMGMGRILSRQGSSGVGMRGPGEKKLEINRRRIHRRIFELEEELKEIEKQRQLRRTQRKKNKIPLVTFVGYTNAGKSTLLNYLSGSDVLAEDKLFATLDPVVRRITLPRGSEILLSDSVGFINKLPHDLIMAFHATLEEVRNADLIVHVIDASSNTMDMQIRTVEDTIASIGAGGIPVIKVFNKTDLLDGKTHYQGSDIVEISALNGTGTDKLLNAIEERLSNSYIKLEQLIPYDKYDVLLKIKSLGNVIQEEYKDGGTYITAMLPEDQMWIIKKMLE